MTLSIDPRDALWLNDVVVAELAGVLARAFEGQEVTAEIGGRPARARLESARLERGILRQGGRVELRDVDWDGWPFERLVARARSVRVSRLPPPRLIATDVEVTGCSALEPLVAWLDARVPRWRLSVGRCDRLEARRRRGVTAYVLELTVADHELHLQLRALRWGRLRLRVPRALHLSRRVVLPPLSGELSVLDARRRARAVEFRLALPTLRLPG